MILLVVRVNWKELFRSLKVWHRLYYKCDELLFFLQVMKELLKPGHFQRDLVREQWTGFQYFQFPTLLSLDIASVIVTAVL